MIVWGMDTACDRLSVAVMESEGRRLLHVESCGPVGSSDAPEMRLGELLTATRAMCDRIADDHPPALADIEKPRGGKKHQDILYGGWAISTAAAARVASRYGGIVRWVEISTWHTAAGFYDLAADAQMAHPLRSVQFKALAAQVARRAGYEGTHVDERDAVCIALAACHQADQIEARSAA